MKNTLLSSGSKLAAVCTLLLATGCAKYHHWVLEDTTGNASPFNCVLYKDYECLGNAELDNMYDECSADYYYQKAICAKSGKIVMPTTLAKWDIEPDHLCELETARARLMAALNAGAREFAPEQAAHAQSNFDCWVEQQSEGWQQDDIASCRAGFYAAMSDVELARMGGVLKIAPAQMIFFDFNSSHLTAAGAAAVNVLTPLATKMGKNQHILLIGRTDKIGDAKHNKHLSKFRALAVKKELIRHGIDPQRITIKGEGETPGPNVDTHNRRVDVLILEYK
jgi:OOP family OmpA-OmpF porin